MAVKVDAGTARGDKVGVEQRDSPDESPGTWPPWPGSAGHGSELAWAAVGNAMAAGSGQDERVAVFDADGTLWGGDVGERHIQVLGERGFLSVPAGHDSVFAAYEALCAKDADAGYAYACEMMVGLAEAAVVDAAREAWRRHAPFVLPDMVTWIRSLEARGVTCWIVSASNRWVVGQAAQSLGLDPERVVAVSAPVEDGHIRGPVETPIPNGTGKVTAIDLHVGQRPLAVFGNSRHDLPMLAQAHVAIVVCARPEGTSAADSEGMVALARERQWQVIEPAWSGSRLPIL